MLDRQARFLLLRNSDDRMRGDIRLSNSEILPTPAWGRNNFWPFGEIAEMAEAFDIPNETGTIEASCWRNLWFMRDGRSYRGPFRFRSEREATALGNRWMDLVKSGGVLMPDGSMVPREAITHFIPVPVRAPAQ
jgi:hypothetical protein